MVLKSWSILGSIVISLGTVPKVTAQLPILPYLQNPSNVSNAAATITVSEWVYLDGRPVFRIGALKIDIKRRLGNIQTNLYQIGEDYYQSNIELNIEVRKRNDLPVIYINDKYLMTVNSLDAKIGDIDESSRANQIQINLQQSLERAKQERQSSYIINQSKITLGVIIVIIICSIIIYRWQRRSLQNGLEEKSPEHESANPEPEIKQPIAEQLKEQKKEHLLEVKTRLFQLTQTGIWSSGIFIILGFFPYTRALQLMILAFARIPVTVGIVLLGIYVVTRFSYALIDDFSKTLISGGFLLRTENFERMQLRVSTFSGVTKSITTLILLGVGTLMTLIALGIDIVPLLAGAGLIGVAISLASQSLIKDAINGFLIIVEDQYAVGDVIAVEDVGGLVENLNLRITQLRDAEGRLITIPNSEIKVVANLSSHWSRADLTIPVSYQTDIDCALKLIQDVAYQMNEEEFWQPQILETPSILGIDNFGDRGMMIRVWIKTQPLKQWDVAREYRRRLKIALDAAGMSIPVPQRSIWVNDTQLLNYQHNSSHSKHSES
ncbi:MAG: mechanosensitive ion channel family protein [Sphaerospermopsis sp. SIO1G2]|nr:mechanosensitive ion channel family protein [Sphaerospermopsis sp. SIO1G2]